MSNLSSFDAENFLKLLGEKGKGIKVEWIKALAAAGVEMSYRPFDPADIKAAVSKKVKPLRLKQATKR